MNIIQLEQNNLDKVVAKAVEILREGGLVVYPTDTAYGIGADATNLEAVEKLWQYKGDRGNKAVAVMVADEEMALEYVEINEIAKGIYEKYLPGAVTVISKSRGKIVKKLENDQGCVGMRIIDNQFCLELCKAFGKPITCTSANISNCLTPYSLSEYQKEVPKEKQAMVTFVDGGQLPQLPVSTVVDTTHDSLMIIRLGRVIIE